MATEMRRANGTRLDASLGITERIAPSMTAWTGDMRKRCAIPTSKLNRH